MFLEFKKGWAFSNLAVAILTVVVVVSLILVVLSVLPSGWKASLRFLNFEDDDIPVLEKTNLERLQKAYEECKDTIGSGCLCKSSFDVAVNDDEKIGIESLKYGSGGVRLLSTHEGGIIIDDVNFCFKTSSKVSKPEECVFEYNDNDARWRIGNEKIGLIFKNKWSYDKRYNAKVESIADSGLNDFFETVLKNGDGWYSSKDNIKLDDLDLNPDALTFKVEMLGEDLAIHSYRGKLHLDTISLPFDGKVFSFSGARGPQWLRERGDSCRDRAVLGNRDCVLLSSGEEFLFKDLDIKDNFGVDSFIYAGEKTYDNGRFSYQYDIYSIDGNLYFAETYPSDIFSSETLDFGELRSVLGSKEISSNLFNSMSDCGSGFKDEAILSLCSELENEDYIGGLDEISKSLITNEDKLIVKSPLGNINFDKSPNVVGEDLDNSCTGLYTVGKVEYDKDKSGYFYSTGLKSKFDFSAQMQPVKLFRYAAKGELFLCVVPKELTAPMCEKNLADVDIMDPLGALYNPYDNLDLEWGMPVNPETTRSLGRFNHPNFDNYDIFYYPQRYKSIHRGVDLTGEIGDSVFAVADGTVADVKDCTYLIHGEGSQIYTSSYCHVDGNSNLVGVVVKKGDVIGTIRDPEGVYAPHIHLELYSAELYNEIFGAAESSNFDRCGCKDDKDCDNKGNPKGCGILEQDYYLIPPEEIIPGL